MTRLILLLVAVSSVLSTASAGTSTAVSGSVTGADGQPVSEAIVRFYKLTYDQGRGPRFSVTQEGHCTTKADGLFVFNGANPALGEMVQGIVVAEKNGLAMGWGNTHSQKQGTISITLGEPGTLAGQVVDEAGKPIPGANVAIAIMMAGAISDQRWLMKVDEIEALHCTTGPDGRFAFTSIPAEASAEFLVHAPGKGARLTFDLTALQSGTLSHTPGQKDIRITLSPEATIKGRVVRKDTAAGVPGLHVQATTASDPWGMLTPDPVVSSTDGSFAFAGIGEGTYQLRIVPGEKGDVDWAAAAAEVTTEAGKTVADIRIDVSKGGMLEIAVTDADGGKPVDKAIVMVMPPRASDAQQAVTNAAGLARLRVSPGDYRVSWVHKQGYTFKPRSETIAVSDGGTHHVDIELQGQPKIRGVVVDVDGKPVPDAEVSALPMGYPQEKSGPDGTFEVAWNPSFAGNDTEVKVSVLARDVEQNLAGVAESDEETPSLKIVLQEGCGIAGRVVGPADTPIPKATVQLQARVGRFGAGIGGHQATDDQGKYAFSALPPGVTYTVIASSSDHGRTQLTVEMPDVAGTQLKADDIALRLANQSLAGIVVDGDGAPVAGAIVYAYGDGQSHRQATTDKKGKFLLQKLCEGQLQVTARTREGKSNGSIRAEAGATDVEIVLGEQVSREVVPLTPQQAASLTGKPLPALDCLGLNITPEDIAGKRVLVCFWDSKQRPSRHVLQQLVDQAGLLTKQDVSVLTVHATQAEQEALKRSLAELGASFPAGQIAGKPSKTLYAWGARGLPWLILTDKAHNVIADGFKIGQLGNLLDSDTAE